MPSRDPYVTTQIYSEYYHSENVEDRKRFSANLIGKNGFICYIQKKNTDTGYWDNIINFYLNEHNMTFLANVIDMVIKDIHNERFNKVRTMEGSKSNMKFMTKKIEDSGNVYIAIRIVAKNEEGEETSRLSNIIFPSGHIYEYHKGIERLKIFRDSIIDTYMGRNQYKRIHYERYSKEIEKLKNNQNEELESNSSDNPFDDIEKDNTDDEDTEKKENDNNNNENEIEIKDVKEFEDTIEDEDE